MLGLGVADDVSSRDGDDKNLVGRHAATAARDGDELLGNDGLAMVQSLLPQIANIGIGVTLRFPPSQGADLLPLTVTGEGSAAATAAQAEEAYLAQAGSPAKINLPITYASDGTLALVL